MSDKPYGREISLTVGQIMYLLAVTTEQLDWGRHRRLAIRAKLLGALDPSERQGIEP